MLAGGGAAYQGIFRNPLADPYLLGVAAGGGLGATIVVISGGSQALLPPAAFAGAAGAVALTYVLGTSRPGRRVSRGQDGTGSILLAGIAVAAMLTAFQTYLQQQHTQTLSVVYSWILGGLSAATWSQIWLVLPYIVVSGVALLAHRRLLDVLRVGETEAASLGVNVARVRLFVVIAATLGVSAAVAVSGLIGFVGIIVPHAIRLTVGSELPRPAAGVDDRGRGVPGPRRRGGADRAGPGRGADRRHHRGRGRAVLPVRAQVPARPAGPDVIGFTDLTVRYGKAVALHAISGCVADGEWLGVIGPNGAGKTTLLNALARLVSFDGHVEVCGAARPPGSAGATWPG